ncbi:hypothetical protein CR513_18037, partial [Mucuna pruriens]
MFDCNPVNTPIGEKADPTLFKSLVRSLRIHIDNKSAQVLAKNLMFHERSKYIDTRCHFIRECIVKKEIELVHVKSQDQVADIFTKESKIWCTEFSNYEGMVEIIIRK